MQCGYGRISFWISLVWISIIKLLLLLSTEFLDSLLDDGDWDLVEKRLCFSHSITPFESSNSSRVAGIRVRSFGKS
jgi:hypothetical protein